MSRNKVPIGLTPFIARDKPPTLPARFPSPPLDQEQVIEWWKNMRLDDWWQSQMPVPRVTISELLNLTPRALSYALEQRHGAATLSKLSVLIPSIENRTLVFPKNTYAPYLWFVLPTEKIIDKLSKEPAWSLWARCAHCGDNKFIPIILNGEDHVACYHCFGEGHYRPIGGRRVKKSLIHEALKNYL